MNNSGNNCPKVTLLNLDIRCSDSHPAPLGLLYLASFLESRNIPTEIRNYGHYQTDQDLYSSETLCGFLEGCGEVIGITALSSNMPLLLSFLNDLKSNFQDRIIVLGGWGPTVDPGLILREFRGADFIISGWAESAFADLIGIYDDVSLLNQIPGLTYRAGNDIRTNPTNFSSFNIDSLPIPSHGMVGFGPPETSIPLLSARGCPSKCAFCDIPKGSSKRIYTRNLDDVLDEIELLRKMKIEMIREEGLEVPKITIGIVDDTFCIRKNRVFEFCDKLEERNIDIDWRISARVDQVDEEMLARMSETGCSAVFFGVDSGSDNVLRKISKGFDSGQAHKAVVAATKHIKTVTASFIWGLPCESMEDFKQTLLFMVLMRDIGSVVSSHLWSPLPRSLLYKNYRDQLSLSKKFLSNIAGDERAIVFDRFKDVIISFPHICAPFYYYPHNDLEQRSNMIQSLGF